MFHAVPSVAKRLRSWFSSRKPWTIRRTAKKARLALDLLEDRFAPAIYDFGDAPASFGVTLGQDGARHLDVGPMLGSSRDAEDDGAPSPNANGDDVTGSPDDENGVAFGSAIIVGQTGASVSVNVQNAPSGAVLNAWLDFGNDGVFGAGDQIAADMSVVNGNNTVTFNVPGAALAGNAFARFRLSTAAGVGATGAAADGEVEDYHVTVSPAASSTQTGTLDTTHYVPPFYAVSGLDSGYIGNQFLALSTPETTPFTVNIRNVAGSVNQNVTISRTGPQVLNLSAAPYGTSLYGGRGIVNDAELNQVNTTDGLILTASKPFYADVRQQSTSQAASLTAKGQSAFGTRFRAGFMNTATDAASDVNNSPTLGGDNVRGHFISVMATADNTTVNFSDIHPGIVFRNGTGTLPGAPGPVTLNRGESYVVGVRLLNVAAPNHNDLNGALVTSTKPIVVNTGSWTAGLGGQDVGFDQLLPASLVGTEYILSKGSATTQTATLETPIVVADSDNTQIFLNGSMTPVATIDAGDYYIVSGANFTSSNTMYIRTSHPAYVYQTTAGSDSTANVGLNFAVAISDAIQPQQVVIANANQLGTATMSIIAPTGAVVSLTGGALATPKTVVGVSGYVVYRQTVTGTVSVSGDKPLFVSLTTANAAATATGYFSGVPNTYAVDDTAVTAFDAPVTIQVMANDNTGAGTFAITTATDPANGAIVVSPDGTITYTPDVGFSGVDTFDYTISSGSITDTATVKVTVLPNVYNFSQPTFSVAEGHSTNTTNVVSIVRSGDTTIAGSIEVSLFAGAGNPATPGVDFVGGTITVPFAPGEVVKSVPIQILGDATDEPNETISLSLVGTAAGRTQPSATLTLLNDDSPATISTDAASVTVDEGTSSVATNSGTFSNAVSLSASLGAIVDNGDGTWSWSYAATDGPLNQSVVLQATTANGSTSSTAFQLTVNNLNPTATLSNNGPVVVGATAVVSFSAASDASSVDVNAGFRYAFDLNNDGNFDVGDGSYIGSGTADSASFPADTVGTRVVRGRIIDKDGGFSDYMTSVTIDPANAPPSIDDQTFSVNENANNAAIVGSVAASDPDAGDTLTYSIAAGNTGGAFAIDANTGVLTVANKAALDFETNPTFALTVQVEDDFGETDTATITVNLLDLATTLSIGDAATIGEGDSGTSVVTFTVTTGAAAINDSFTVGYTTQNGAASDSSDFEAATGTLSFNGTGGETRQISVTVNGDTTVELHEAFQVLLSGLISNDVAITDGSGQGTINNDDSAVLKVADASAAEGNGGTAVLTFVVTLSNPVDVPVSFDYRTADGSATTANNDYLAVPTTTFTLSALNTSGTIAVTVNGDTTVELDEVLSLALSNLQTGGRNITSDHFITQTINFTTFTVANYQISSEAGNTAWNVGPSDTVTQPSSQNFGSSVFYGPASLTVGTRFTGTLVSASDDDYIGFVFGFQPGDHASAAADFLLIDWKDQNQDRDFTGGTAANSSNTGGGTALEGLALSRVQGIPTQDEFWTHRSLGGGPGAVTQLVRGINFGNQGYRPGSKTFDITWTADRILVLVNGQVEIDYTGANIPTAGRFGLYQAFEQGFTFSGVQSTPAVPVGRIVNDDSASIAIGNASVTEGGSLQFAVTLSQPVDVNTVITFSTANGTATTGDSDYTARTNQTLTIPAGQTSGTITIATTADNKVELDESLVVNLSAVSAGGRAVTFSDAQGAGTILNDDSATVAIGDATVAEGGSLAFTVTLSRAVDVTTVITFSTADGAATTADSDYVPRINQTLTINAGQTTGTIAIATTTDAKVELNETMTVNLSAVSANGRSVTIADNSGAGTIANNDSATMSINDVTSAETDGATTITFTVTLSNPVDTAVSAEVQTVDGTAVDATSGPGSNDYDSPAATVNFAVGTSSQTISVTVNGDDLAELDETFLVNLLNLQAGGRAVTLADSQGLGTIVNDDFAPVATAGGPYTIGEGQGVALSAVGTTDADSANLTYRWDVNGDGSFAENTTGLAPSLTWAQLQTLGINDGLTTRTLRVEASDGTNTGVATTTFTVNNTAPTVTSDNATVTATEGQTATNSGTWSDPGQDVVTLTASVGVVTKNANGTWSWTYAATDGPVQSQAVTITANDGDPANNIGATTFNLVVNNVDVSYDAGADETLPPPVAGAFSRTVSFTDPGADVWSGTVNYGDSTGDQPLNVNQAAKTFSLAHTYTTQGVYPVSVTLKDDDGNPVVDSFQLNVILNQPPVVNRDNAAIAVEKGQLAVNTGTFSDPQGNATVALVSSLGTVVKNDANGTWSWSAGSGTLAIGSQTVTVTATDNFGETASTSFTLTVNPASTSSTIAAPAITYGDNGSVTVTLSSALGVVTGAVSLSVDGGSPITQTLANGSYTFTLSYLSAGSHSLVSAYATQGDFAASGASGVIFVDKAGLTVTAADQSKVYGAAIPALSGSLVGVVNGDNITASFATTATSASDVGSYPIAPSLSDPDGRLVNYVVTSNPGVLTITKANQTITWANPADIVYGTPLGSAQLNASVAVVGPASAGALTYTPAAGTVLQAGASQALQVAAAATNNYNEAAASVAINVNKAPLTVAADDKSMVYGGALPALTVSYSGFVNGDTLSVLAGAPALSTTATTGSNAGNYPISIDVGSLVAANYAFSFVSGVMTVGKASTGTATAVSAVTPLYGVDGETLSAAISVIAPGGGSPTGSVSFFDGSSLLGSASVVSGSASISIGSTALAVGAHAITAVYSGDNNFFGSSQSQGLTVLAPSSIQGLVFSDFNDDGELDYGEKAIAGVVLALTGKDDLGNSVSRSATTDAQGIYTFGSLRPSDAAGYKVVESQPAGLPDGKDTAGTIAGGTTLATGNDTFTVRMSGGGSYAQNYNFGERPATTGSVVSGQTATIGFWHNKNGQALIVALNGGSASKQLGNWLSQTFPNMYSALAGKTNAEVAAFYKTLFARTSHTAPGGPPKTDAQVMATALAVYVTNQALAGTTASAYGFTVSATGVGTRTFNVGTKGAAFGVANNSTVSVIDLLLAVNARSKNGLLYDLNGNGVIDSGEVGYRTMANDLFSAINEAGDI